MYKHSVIRLSNIASYSAANNSINISFISETVLSSLNTLNISHGHNLYPPASNYHTFSNMIGGVPIVVFLLVTCQFQFVVSDFGWEIGRLLDELAGAKKNDILFLIDAFASLSSREFESEKNFIGNFLSAMTVAFDASRVEVIPFADTASRYIDGISNPSFDKHKCDLVEKLKFMPHGSNGYGRDISVALELATKSALEFIAQINGSSFL